MGFSGRFVLPLFFLGCLITVPSFADSGTDFSNTGGTLTGTTASLSLSGSTLTVVAGFKGGSVAAGDLGTVSFTTGALISGSIRGDATFAEGGTFRVEGNGSNGIPSEVLFSGSFSSPSKWVITNLDNGTHNYTLTGEVRGMMDGKAVDGVAMVLTINTGKGYFDGATAISGGDTVFSASVPEPSTFALFGAGTFMLAGAFRRKALAAR
jgi:hypothetical protein